MPSAQCPMDSCLYYTGNCAAWLARCKRWLNLCTVPQNFELRPMRKICFDLVKACEWVFLFCFLGQIVTWQYNSNLLDWNWPCTVINDHNWQLRNGQFILSLNVVIRTCCFVTHFTYKQYTVFSEKYVLCYSCISH